MLLNLLRLNLKSPYKIWPSHRPNEYIFMTDYGGVYYISFMENQLIWADHTYEFGIIPMGKRVSSPNDTKLKQTVITVLEDFFYENPNVLLYQCETGDSKQAMRARLFQRWFDGYEHKDKYYIKVAMIMDENVENYDAILIKRDNPHFNEIVEQFDSFVHEMGDKPHS